MPTVDYFRAQRLSRAFHSSLRHPHVARGIAAREGFPVSLANDRLLDAPYVPLASHLQRVTQALSIVQRRVLRGHPAPPFLRHLWWSLLLWDDRGVEELLHSQPSSLPPPSQWPCQCHPYARRMGGAGSVFTLFLSPDFATGPFLMQPHGEWGSEEAPASRLKGWEPMAARSRRFHWFAGREEETQCGGFPAAEGNGPFPRLLGFYSGHLRDTTDRWGRPMLEEAREQPRKETSDSWERLPVVEWRSRHGGLPFAFCCLHCYCRLTRLELPQGCLDRFEAGEKGGPHSSSPLFRDPNTGEECPNGRYLHLPSRLPYFYCSDE